MKLFKPVILQGVLKNKFVLAVLIALVVIDVVSLVVFFKAMSDYPVHHFDEVIPGTLYRGAQPDPERWKVLRDQYHIRTVVNFRFDDPGDENMLFEKEFCQANKIKLVRVAMDDNPPTPEELKLFLDTVTNPANQPVLVHCELGRSRTGVMVAAYRIKCNGWTAEKAIEESLRFKQNIRPVYVKYLKELAAQKEPAKN